MYRLHSDTPGPACKFDPQKLAVFVHILLDLWMSMQLTMWLHFKRIHLINVFLGTFETGGSDTESDDDHDKDEGAGAGDGDTDEEDEVFFDTRDSLKSLTSGRYNPPADCVLPEQGEVDMELIGFDYPRVQRRKALPDPKEKEKSVSLWSMIKDNIGKDLTKVCLPVYFNEPISSLQRCFEDVEYSYLLDRAYEYGKRVRVWPSKLIQHYILSSKKIYF